MTTTLTDQPPIFVRGKTLLVHTWPDHEEYEPVRRPSGRIAWPDFVQGISKQAVHDQFDLMYRAGEKLDNDHYSRVLPDLTFDEFAAVWRNKIVLHPFTSDISAIATKQPTHQQLKQLHKVLIDFPLFDRHWEWSVMPEECRVRIRDKYRGLTDEQLATKQQQFSTPGMDQSHEFSDALLVHVNAILDRKNQPKLKSEFQYGYYQPSKPESKTDSAAAKLFAVIRELLLDETGRRRSFTPPAASATI